MTKPSIDPRILQLCAQVTAKRARMVIDHILTHGSITTEDIQYTYHYDHPPRAVCDVREQGIPLERFSAQSTRSNRKIAAYRFGNPDDIKHGRIHGRKAFSKGFKAALVARYGQVDALTAQPLEMRYLQIDHRIPYQIAGDVAHDESDLDAYMLLDASSQRAKSWSCEQCPNSKHLQQEVHCQSCYWAFPEAYTHAAMVPMRRIDLQWSGEEAAVYDQLAQEAERQGVSVHELIKHKLQQPLPQSA